MKNKLKTIVPILLNIVLYVLASLFMYNAYKAISGFVANNADDGLKMMTLITSYLTPVLCYLYFFYTNYVKKPGKVTKLIYSSLVIILGIFNLVNIFLNINLYVSNNSLGVYEATPSIFFGFPYDMIVVNLFLVLLQIFNIIRIFVRLEKVEDILSYIPKYGYFKIRIWEYLIYCIVAILAFFALGDFFIAFKGIRNTLYDPKYIYLMIWVLTIPTLNLFALIFKVEDRNLTLTKKNIYLSTLILINVLLTGLLFLFEYLYPNFVIYIGKPLFPITFSVSLPIEFLVMLALAALPSIYYVVKIVLINIKKKEAK